MKTLAVFVLMLALTAAVAKGDVLRACGVIGTIDAVCYTPGTVIRVNRAVIQGASQADGCQQLASPACSFINDITNHPLIQAANGRTASWFTVDQFETRSTCTPSRVLYFDYSCVGPTPPPIPPPLPPAQINNVLRACGITGTVDVVCYAPGSVIRVTRAVIQGANQSDGCQQLASPACSFINDVTNNPLIQAANGRTAAWFNVDQFEPRSTCTPSRVLYFEFSCVPPTPPPPTTPCPAGTAIKRYQACGGFTVDLVCNANAGDQGNFINIATATVRGATVTDGCYGAVATSALCQTVVDYTAQLRAAIRAAQNGTPLIGYWTSVANFEGNPFTGNFASCWQNLTPPGFPVDSRVLEVTYCCRTADFNNV